MKSLPILFLVLLISQLEAQTPIEIADNTIKIKAKSTETFYYGFAEGDQIIFSFDEQKGKKLKAVEVTEYPSTSKFAEFKVCEVKDKKITVPATGVYQFKFTNSNLGKRVCNFKIHRIPASKESVVFDSNVRWKTAYDTIRTTTEKHGLIRRDTIISNFVDQLAKVHSRTNFNGRKTSFNFTLPTNTVAWSYYVGVNQEGQEAYQEAVTDLSKNLSPWLATIPEYGPLAALALTGISYIPTLQKGEDVDYYILDEENTQLFFDKDDFDYIKKGKVINDFHRMTDPVEGEYHFCLSNDNAIKAIRVSIKITAIQVVEEWGLAPVEQIKLVPIRMPYLVE